MRTEQMLFQNLCYVASMLLILSASTGAAGEMMSRCKEKERRALLDFKADVVDEHGLLSSWDNNNEQDCCKWRGIRCSNLTGHITVLNLPGIPSEDYDVGLSGKLSPSFTELKYLKYLNLSHHFFVGNIPYQLGNLTNLRYLDLGTNRDLTVENLDWLSHLRSLKYLDMSYTDLSSGTTYWLNQIFKLSSLTHLLLRSCSLPDYNSSLPLNNTLFPSNMNYLAVVDLSSNYFTSPWSYKWLFNFTSSLVYVDLSFNSFLSGSSIPESFGSMLSLETLNLAACDLKGMLPQSFRNLSHLARLDLKYNNINGSLSKFLYPLATKEKNPLEVLQLNQNQLEGSLPDYFTRFPLLRDLSISSNKLSGSFPDNFAQLSPSLANLELYDNQLTGPLPNLTLFSSLETLILSNNKLEDTIPEAYLSNLSKLKYLDLSSKSLSFNISFNWNAPFKLDRILLRNCYLGPHFPNWIKSQYNFSMFDISNAGISDTIPLWFWDLSLKLRNLNMSYNQIGGILPDISMNFPDIEWIDLSYNRLQGPIPPIPEYLVLLDLTQNMLTGSLSIICHSYMFLSYLYLSYNRLSGELPADCLKNIDSLENLNLASNNFSGDIPTSIGLLNRLRILQLRDNNFTGQVPSSLMNNTYLRLLDLSRNNLSGEVPTWIGTDLTSLIVLSLSDNEFSGSIPPHICHLEDAQVLDFSHNNLRGSIPDCISNITSLVEAKISNGELNVASGDGYGDSSYKFANAVVQWKGVAAEYKKTLELLKLIDLSSNRLVGNIPEDFASLKGLISLNLSRNNLTGYIIPKIGKMKNLESLDLSRNHLSGEIPSSLASLTLLSILDLSNNSLRGGIPTSTQLQSFDPSKYAGNLQLCGLPLPNKCRGIDYVPAGRNDENKSNAEDNDKFPKLGLYVSVVLGFATGFWGFICPVMLRRTRRRSYYRVLSNITDWIYVRTKLNMAKLQRKFYS